MIDRIRATEKMFPFIKRDILGVCKCSLELKTWPEQLSGSLPLEFALHEGTKPYSETLDQPDKTWRRLVESGSTLKCSTRVGFFANIKLNL